MALKISSKHRPNIIQVTSGSRHKAQSREAYPALLKNAILTELRSTPKTRCTHSTRLFSTIFLRS